MILIVFATLCIRYTSSIYYTNNISKIKHRNLWAIYKNTLTQQILSPVSPNGNDNFVKCGIRRWVHRPSTNNMLFGELQTWGKWRNWVFIPGVWGWGGGGGAKGGARHLSVGEEARWRHHNEIYPHHIYCAQMAWGAMGAHGVNGVEGWVEGGGGGMAPPGPS